MHKEKIVGIHAVRILLKIRPFDVYEIFLTDKNSSKYNEIISLAKENNISINKMSAVKIYEYSNVKSHQGVLAFTKRKKEILEKNLFDFLKGKSKDHVILILDEFSDSRNFGACLRICDAYDISAVIVKDYDFTKFNETAKKVAAGAAETVPIIRVKNISRVLNLLKKNNYWTYAASERAEHDVNEIQYKFPLALVIGDEGKGLRKKTLENCDFKIKINMLGEIESLNLAVAAGVIINSISLQIK